MNKSLSLSFKVLSIIVLSFLELIDGYCIGGNIESKIHISNLRVENAVNPYIEESNPRFSWELQSTKKAVSQSAYQIVVSSTIQNLDNNNYDLWNSGKVDSDQNILVDYNGKELNPATRYYLKVRVWDNEGNVTPFSSVAWWEMGLMNQSNWGKARFISAPDSYLNEISESGFTTSEIPIGEWLYLGKPKTRAYLRRDITIDNLEAVNNFLVKLQSDFQFEMYVNGNRIEIDSSHGWDKVPAVNVKNKLVKGLNQIAVEVFNSSSLETAMKVELSIRGGIQISYSDGSPERNILSGWSDSNKWYLLSDDEYYANYEPTGWNTFEPLSKTDSYAPAGWNTIDSLSNTIKIKLSNSSEYFHSNISPWAKRRSLYMRKEFNVTGIQAARVYITSKGLYELRMNGSKVGDKLITPPIADRESDQRDSSNNRHIYQIYDVTDMLKDGNNVIGVITGNGPYNEFDGWLSWRFNKHQVIIKLVVTKKDGSQYELVSDGSWKVHTSPHISTTTMYGDRYDARLELPDWDKVGYNGSSWVNVAVENNLDSGWDMPPALQTMDPVKVQAIESPSKMTIPPSGGYLADFNQQKSGRSLITLHNTRPGQIIEVYYGEELKNNGNIERNSYLDVYHPVDSDYEGKASYFLKNLDIYICKGAEEEVFQPKFAFTAFRYIQVKGLTKAPSKDDIKRIVFYADINTTGSFVSSNEDLNRIYKATRFGWLIEQINGPIADDTREKCYWPDYAGDFGVLANYLTDNSRYLAQYTKHGRILTYNYMPGWIDEYYITPLNLYYFYGDKKPLKDNYDKIKKLVDSRSASEKEGLWDDKNMVLTDWAPPIGGPNNVFGPKVPDLNKLMFSNLYYYRSVKSLSVIAKILGKTDDYNTYSTKAGEIKTAYNGKFFDINKKRYFNPESGIAQQGDQLGALDYGLVDKKYEQDVMYALNDLVVHNEYYPGRFTTGMNFGSYLGRWLSKGGYSETMLDGMLNPSYPSLLNMLNSGSTVIAEMWEGLNYMRLGGKPMISMGLYHLGNQVTWYFENLGGIQYDPENPGFKSIILKPCLPKDISFVDVSYNSVYGKISSSWIRKNNLIEWSITIPTNTTATVFIPYTNIDFVEIDGVQAKTAYGVKYIDIKEGRAVFEFQSGVYKINFPVAKN